MILSSELSPRYVPETKMLANYLDVCAVVVTYHPSEGLESNLAALRPQVGGIVIVDNASRPEIQPFLDRVSAQNSCTLIRNPENYGIARALNQGIQAAEQQGFHWVVMFDQDSTVEQRFIENLLRVYADSPDPSEIAAVAPQYIDRGSGRKIDFDLSTRNGELLYSMTSGTLVNVNTFGRVGYHEEDLFIDYVDIEWCLRARSLGMKVLESSDAKLVHSLGNLKHHKFFFHDVPVPNHSVARCYYRERNRWHIYLRRSWDWDWLRKDLYLQLTNLATIVLWEDDRWRKLKVVARGVLDAMRGRMGRNTEIS